jgi:branched-subunit amino acid transport protein AzlD
MMVRLEKQLPCAIMILLVVYCIKGVSFSDASSWISTFTGISVTALIHLKKKNVLLSILAGTLVYMMFVQFVF